MEIIPLVRPTRNDKAFLVLSIASMSSINVYAAIIAT